MLRVGRRGWVIILLVFFLGGLLGIRRTRPALAQYAGSARAAQHYYSRWQPGFFISGASAYLNSVVYHDGLLYAAGGFMYMDGQRVNQVAVWDMATKAWAPLGQGITAGGSFGQTVSDMAVDSSGDLYIAGNFTAVDGVAANSVARWDGSQWHALGDGLPGGQAMAIAIDDADNVYVGGNFTTAGSTAANYVAMWDGSNWSALGDGLNQIVLALAYDDETDMLYAGGVFTRTGDPSSLNLNYIGAWNTNTSAWEQVGVGVNYGTNDYVYSLHVDHMAPTNDSLIHIGGSFTEFAEISASNCVLHAPTQVPSVLANCDTNGTVFTIEVLDALFIGGDFTQVEGKPANNVAVNDGSGWTQFGEGTNGSVRDMAVVNWGGLDFLFAGGLFNSAGTADPGGSPTLPENYIAVWQMGGTGDQWRPVTEYSFSETGGMNGIVNDIAIDQAGRATIVGRFSAVAGMPYNYIYDDLGAVSSGGGTDDVVYAVAHTADMDIYIGGMFTEVEGVSAQSIAFWDSAADTWSALGTEDLNGPVYAIAVDGTDVYVGGDFDQIGSTPVDHIARWDSATDTWHTLGEGVNDTVNDLLVVDDTLYVGGRFTSTGIISLNYVAAWDGSAWSDMGGGVDNVVEALAADSNGDIYVGGYFLNAGGSSAPYLARWNHTAWTGLISTLSGVVPSVTTMAFDGHGNLIISGDFTSVNGMDANHIALYDGTDWAALDWGLSFNARALAFDSDGTLYAGGCFERAGAHPSAHFAVIPWEHLQNLPMIVR